MSTRIRFSRALVFLLVLAATPAQAEELPSDQAMARVMASALAPTSYGDWAYRWDAVSSRVSSLMHWHLPDPDDRDRPTGAEVRRNGWINSVGRQIGVSAFGGDDGVRALTFRSNDDVDVETLLGALHAQGVEVEIRSEATRLVYVLTPAGRRSGVLTAVTECTSPHSRAAQRCWTDYTLELAL